MLNCLFAAAAFKGKIHKLTADLRLNISCETLLENSCFIEITLNLSREKLLGLLWFVMNFITFIGNTLLHKSPHLYRFPGSFLSNLRILVFNSKFLGHLMLFDGCKTVQVHNHNNNYNDNNNYTERVSIQHIDIISLKVN